jgi:hypothetical protein
MTLFAHYDYRESNRIGISVGVNKFTFNTNNFQTIPEIDLMQDFRCGEISTTVVR